MPPGELESRMRGTLEASIPAGEQGARGTLHVRDGRWQWVGDAGSDCHEDTDDDRCTGWPGRYTSRKDVDGFREWRRLGSDGSLEEPWEHCQKNAKNGLLTLAFV